jgi:hypothetical protein
MAVRASFGATRAGAGQDGRLLEAVHHQRVVAVDGVLAIDGDPP